MMCLDASGMELLLNATPLLEDPTLHYVPLSPIIPVL